MTPPDGRPDDVLRQGVSGRLYAGVAARVVRAGDVVHEVVLGDAFHDEARREPLGRRVIRHRLVHEGGGHHGLGHGAGHPRRLSLDDPLGRYLPSPDAAITLRHLLTHRAGLVEWQPLYLGSGTRDEAVALAAALPLRYRVGEGRHYSDHGLILTGAVVERVTGMRLDEAVREVVTAPLGMTSTGYGPVSAERAVAYGHGDDIEQAMVRDGEPYPVTLERTHTVTFRTGWVRGEVSDGNAFHALRGISGHAGLFSTLDDLTRFATALLDESPVWSRPVLDAFLQPGPDDQAVGFWWLPAAGGPAYGHPGFTGARFLVDPAARSVAVLLSNRLHVMAPGQRVPPDIGPLWLDYLAASGFTR